MACNYKGLVGDMSSLVTWYCDLFRGHFTKGKASFQSIFQHKLRCCLGNRFIASYPTLYSSAVHVTPPKKQWQI